LIKKKLGMFLAPVLLVGLVACNNNDDKAFDTARTNRDRNMNDNGTLNVRNNGNYGIDHAGPLTEDYDLNRDRDNGFRTRNVNDDDNNKWIDQSNGRNHKNKNNDSTISSYNTNMSSKKYPHTKAILIQEAKYQFAPVNSKQAAELEARLRQKAQELAQTPAQQQRPTAQAPTQQQRPTAQAPTQQQRPTAQAPAQQPKAAAPAPTQPKAAAPAPAGQQQQATGSISQFAQQVIDLTNVQRKQNGLPALQADTKLSGVAEKKSIDMQQKNYFSHTSPTYGSPFDMMRDFGVTYKSAGENIAQGQQTPQAVVQAWMNSEGHRKNILSPNFTHIGVGHEKTGNHWTQMFIGK
jgi:uncharacterized YkwD family protein